MDYLSLIGVLGISLGVGLLFLLVRSQRRIPPDPPRISKTHHNEETCTPTCVCDERRDERDRDERARAALKKEGPQRYTREEWLRAQAEVDAARAQVRRATGQARAQTTVVRSCPACHKLNRVPVSRLADSPKCGGCGFYLDASPNSDSVKMFCELMKTLRVMTRNPTSRSSTTAEDKN